MESRAFRSYETFSRQSYGSSPRGLPKAPTVFVVDDDRAFRDALSYLLSSVGYEVAGRASAGEALQQCEPRACGCYLLDLHLPDMNGLELREQLRRRGSHQPFIVITGYGEVSTAVRALQGGAVDFIEKPFDRQRLLERVKTAVCRDAQRRHVQGAIDSLTDRERELLPMIADGMLSKEIARRLGISPRTVEVHRRNIMHKMDEPNVAQLVCTLTKYFSEKDATDSSAMPHGGGV